MTGIIDAVGLQLVSADGRETLERGLRGLSQDAALGSDPGARTEAGGPSVAESEPSESAQAHVLDSNVVELSTMYRDSQRRADATLAVSVAMGMTAVLAGLALLWIGVRSELPIEPLMGAVGTTIPGLLGGAIFVIHRGQKARLEAVESDIRLMQRVSAQLLVIARMPEEKAKQAGREAVLEQLRR